MQKRYWDVVGDSIAGLLIILNLLSTRDLKVETGPYATLNRDLSVSIITFFLVEFLVKWLFLGIKVYFHTFRNRVDFLIFVCIFLILLVGGCSNKLFYEGDLTHQTDASSALEIILVARLLLYPRNIACFANPVGGVSWGTIISTISRLVFTFAEAFLCIGFTFAQAGCWIFGGDIVQQGVDPKLDRSPYGESGFYELNFNDMPTSFYTLFSCLRVSDFDTITSGFVITSSTWARWYFVVWYIVGYMLLFNIVRSYFICVFQTRSRSEAQEIITDMQQETEQTETCTDAEESAASSSTDAPVQNTQNPQNTQEQEVQEKKAPLSAVANLFGMAEQEVSGSASLDSLKENYTPGRSSQSKAQGSPSKAQFQSKHRTVDAVQLAEEIEPLELMNLNHQFVIDLSVLARSEEYVSLDPKAEDCPDWEEHTNKAWLNEKRTASKTRRRSSVAAVLAGGSSHKYLATLGYVRDMEQHVRCDLLKRLKVLSDRSAGIQAGFRQDSRDRDSGDGDKGSVESTASNGSISRGSQMHPPSTSVVENDNIIL